MSVSGRLKILIFIEVDVVVRHFIHSRAFADICRNHDVLFVFNSLGHKRLGSIDPAKLDLPAPYIHLSSHPRRTFLWKRLFLTDQLRWRPGKQTRMIRKMRRRTLGWKASILLSTLALPGIHQVYSRRIRQELARTPFPELTNLIRTERPDVILHPCVLEGEYLNDLIEAGKTQHVPSVVIMNSWDNPSTKRSMVGAPDRVLVWGPQTRQHTIEFAQVPADQVVEFGVAQFEVYRQPPRITREEFLTQNNLPADRPVMLYAGSSTGTAEIDHLELLDRAISDGRLPPCSVLYRPHPWGNGGAGGEKILDQNWQNVFIEESMRGYLERVRAGDYAKYLSDYRDTHDVLSHIDCLISPLSTIILEGALHAKPVMCFMPTDDASAHFKENAGFTHFHDMLNHPQILISYGRDGLLRDANRLLESAKDADFKERLLRSCAHFVSTFDATYSERLDCFLRQLVEGAKKT